MAWLFVAMFGMAPLGSIVAAVVMAMATCPKGGAAEAP
jgi:hypothetical protein